MRNKSKILILAIFSGSFFLFALYFKLSQIPLNWYVARDDGVITLSTARNLVDYGFIGVNPSGPIVEASSAPVQQFLYAGLYWMTHVGYLAYSRLQTYISYFAIGLLFFFFFRERPFRATFLSVIGALALSFFPSFYEWQASGMENAITNLLFLLSIFLLYETLKRGRINYLIGPAVLMLASLSRIEDIYHIGPLIFVFAIFWRIKHKNLNGFFLLGAFLALWLIFMLWRYYYFGQLLPNTAFAQDISVSDRLRWLFSLNIQHLYQSYLLSKKIFLHLGVWVGLIFFLVYLASEKNIGNNFLTLLCVSLIATALFNPFLFGPTRIDEVRTVSFVPLIMVLLIANWLYNAKSIRGSAFIGLALFPVVALAYTTTIPKPYYLGWSTIGFDDVRKTFIKLAKNNNINRPTISNSDLGVITWHKQFNDVDLGMLGSPIVARLRNGPELLDYLLNYAEPDFIEAHGAWVGRFCDSIFLSKEFSDNYIQYNTDYNIKAICAQQWNKMPLIIWERKKILNSSSSAERKLLNDLQIKFSVKTVKDEISQCYSINSGNPKRCMYIARTVYRFLPEIRRAGEFDKVLALFKFAPDRALLNGWKNPQSFNIILNSVYNDIYKIPDYPPSKLIPDGKNKFPPPFRIYYKEGVITYVKSKCKEKDIFGYFYLHVSYKKGGFDNMDFKFHKFGHILGDQTCIAIRNIPGNPISIATGRFGVVRDFGRDIKYRNFWGAEILIDKEY